MEQLNQIVSIQHAVRMVRQTGANDFPVASAAGDTGCSEETREHLANVATEPEMQKSILTVMYEQEVKNAPDESMPDEALCGYQEELRQLSAQLLTIQESERQRIAADLHDGIGQSLSLIKLSLESVMQQLTVGENKKAAQSLMQLTQKVKETMSELHRTTMDMRPSMLDDLGIIPTLSWFFREFESAWRGRKIERDVSIVEEAVNNIVKHADADLIRVSLKKTGGMLHLSIEDNGRGFDLAGISVRGCSGHGFGLLTMKERARSSGGTFDMKSSLEQGTRICISWQLTNGAAGQAAAQLPCVRKSARRGNR
jgi:signal transduction histidine kinase